MFNFVINIKPKNAPQEMYEIHNFTAGCEQIPEQDNALHLGAFHSANEARERARKLFIHPQLCHLCCPHELVIPILQPRSDWVGRFAYEE